METHVVASLNLRSLPKVALPVTYARSLSRYEILDQLGVLNI